MAITIALAGNPNCGKSTLFNALTGSRQYVGNWPGVTVEKKGGKLKSNKEVTIEDLPGIYSLSPYTLEEVVSRNYLVNEKPDVIINIVDGTNLERNLYLTTQILELGIPTIIAVNMLDILEKNGEKLNLKELEKALGVQVVSISALKGTGVDELVKKATELGNGKIEVSVKHEFDKALETAIERAEEKITGVEGAGKRFLAIKALEKDSRLAELISDVPNVDDEIKFLEEEFDDDTESIITNERYNYISSIIGKVQTKKKGQKLSTSDKIDRVVTNRWLALPIFAAVMTLVYYVSITTIGTWATDWVNDVFVAEWIQEPLRGVLENANVAEWLVGLICDGIIAGVGAVIGFLPQMLVLFVFLAFLEECGYMARVAFIMDRIFRKFGLSGKSFIPILIGTGCGVPAVMATRTIENERDRRMSVMTTTFIPCGAKLPIIAFIAGACFGGSGLISVASYFIGIAAIICSGILLKKTKMFSGDPAPFVMELPDYHWPTPGAILRSMGERGWSFVKKATTIIALSTIVIWFLQAFGVEGGSFTMVEDIDNSILARFGMAVAVIFKPLGWGFWRAAVGAITGLIAKENVVSTFGILFHYAGELSENGDEIWTNANTAFAAGGYGTVAAFSYLVFNLLCAPCFAAMGAIKREMNSTKWFLFAIGYQCLLAYCVSLVVYQIGIILMGASIGIGTIVAVLLIIAFLFLLFRPYKEATTLNTKVTA